MNTHINSDDLHQSTIVKIRHSQYKTLGTVSTGIILTNDEITREIKRLAKMYRKIYHINATQARIEFYKHHKLHKTRTRKLK